MPESKPLSQTEALLAGVRGGNQEAFEAIFRTYYGQVFAVAYRLLGAAAEADDVAQEAFLRLYRRPLPPGREHNLGGWLLRVATNLGYNALRSRQRRQAWERAASAELTERPDPEEAAESADVAGRVRLALAGLPERQVQLLLLRQAGLSYAELAEALAVAPGSVGTLLARAERAFRQRYSELEDMENEARPDPLSR